jgi:putative IMPACT (imprinted ancient) family translation regulator
MDFNDDRQVQTSFELFEKVIKDRKSVYSVSVGRVECKDDIQKFLYKIRNYNKKYTKATHHSYAARISKDGVVYETKGDDGEAGAGNVILRMIQKHRFTNTIVCVTRWFGGIQLHSDRFKHVQDATLSGLKKVVNSK